MSFELEPAHLLPGLSDYVGWMCGPVGRTRDSDALERSNWEVVTADLLALARELPDGRETVEIHRFGHWAVGWIEEVVISPDAPDALAAAQGWAARLDRYPVADEEHYAETEYCEHDAHWRAVSMRERVEMCRRAGVSVFAARRPDVPCAPNGEYVTA